MYEHKSYYIAICNNLYGIYWKKNDTCQLNMNFIHNSINDVELLKQARESKRTKTEETFEHSVTFSFQNIHC
jgi:hypothetical protein